MAKKRRQLLTLRKVLEKEIQDTQISADKTRRDAYEVAQSAAGSPSQSGDRFHAGAQADIVEKRLEDMKLCLDEVVKASEGDIPKKVTKTCYVELVINSGVTHKLFVLNNTATIPIEAKIVSEGSPLGRAIVGKKINQKFEYDPTGTGVTVKGKVNEIE